MKRPTLLFGLFYGLTLLVITVSTAPLGLTRDDQVVVFTANWCANCREVVPILRQAASENGLSINIIDVDSPDAPKQSATLGVAIPSSDLPRAYLINNNKVKLIFDGTGYRYGQGTQAKTSIVNNLQASR